MANIGFPGTSSFIGEFLIILGVFKFNIFVSFFMSLGVILSACYAVWLYNRLFFGVLNSNFIFFVSDLNKREFFILLPFLFLVLLTGIYPLFIFDVFNFSLYYLLCF